MTKKILIVISAIIVVALITYGVQFITPKIFGATVTGQVHWQTEAFRQGFYAGTGNQFFLSNAGAITSSAANTFSGVNTLSGTNTLSGATTASGALTATSDVRVKAPVFTGSIASITQTYGATSSVITAAQVCDSTYATTTPSITEASTLTTPAMNTLTLDCMTTNGDERVLTVLNTTASTTVVTAGASSTIYYDGATGGTATLAASSAAVLRFVRTSAITMSVFMTQFKP